MPKIGYLLGTRICWKSPDLDHSLWHKRSKAFNTKLPLLRHLWFFWDGVLVDGMAPQQEETEQSMSGERVTMQLLLKGNFEGRFEHFSRQRFYLHYNFDNRHDSWHLRWCKYIHKNQQSQYAVMLVPTMVYEGCVIGRLAFYSLSPFTFCNSHRPYFTKHILKPKYP